MTLLELLRQELPKRGGWPEGAAKAVSYNFIPGVHFWDNDRFGVDYSDLTTRVLVEATVTREQYEATGWDGTGLPPVGCDVEYSWAGEPWASGVIRYISKHTIIIETQADSTGDTECAYHPTDIKFRPLRTEAEHAIDEMVRLSGVSIGAAKILYDAGYRKG